MQKDDVKNGDVYANLGNYFRPFFNPLSEILVKEISNFSKEDIFASKTFRRHDV